MPGLIEHVLLSLLTLLLARPVLAGDPAPVESEDPEVEEPPEVEDVGEVPAPAAEVPAAPLAAEARVADEPWLPTPGEAAVEAVGVALDRIVALELLLLTSEALDLEGARVELDAVRVALRLALVELGRLRQDEDLRSWLLAEGLAEAREEPPAASAEDPPVEPGLSSDRLRLVAGEIEAVSFTEGKMQVLTRQLDGEKLTTDQASSLLELFSFSRDRVDALVFFHPRISDPENFDGLLSALKFESDRETVRNQVGAQR